MTIQEGLVVIIRSRLFHIRAYPYYILFFFYDFYDIKENIKVYIKKDI